MCNEIAAVGIDHFNQDSAENNAKKPKASSLSSSPEFDLERFFEIDGMQCIAGFDGYLKRVNTAFSKNLGFTTDELLAQPLINFVYPEDRAATLAELDNLTAGESTISFENRYLTKDGRYRWLLWTAKPYTEEGMIYAAARDITQRKQSELALQENEARWQLALKGANDGIWDWNVKTNEVFFSHRWKEMLGFADDEIENTLEEWSKRVHPDDLGWVTETIQAHFAGKTPFYISEHRLLCKDGSYKWILDRGQALWDKQGNVVRMAGSHTDITDRKQAQAELARSENMLRTIIDSEPECVKTLGRDGTLLEINPAGLETIEADVPEDAIGKSVFPLIDSHYRQAFVELTESIFEGKSGRLEFKLTGLKGTTRWLETNAVPLKKDSEITALLAVTRDITQRKQAELQLQQERDFSHAVIDTVGALVAVLDRQGEIVSFNHTCERVTGYSLAEVQGKKVWDFLIPPPERIATEAVFQKLLSGQFHNQYENCWLAKDGSKNLISWSNTALCNEEGQVEFIIATGIDVTEQRRVWNKLEFQYRQTKLLTEITDKIRMSIELEEILQTTVIEVQQILACDRVLIVEIQSNNTALPISEAILADLPPMLGYELADPLLMGSYLAEYHQGKVLALNDLATAAIDSDIKQLLNQFQIQAKLVVPILNQHELKGLLIAHQCYSPRQWQEPEIQLLNQLADRLGVALSQAKLLDYAEKIASKRTRELTVTNQLLESEIVEREQTERDLRENQQKLAGILDNADEAIITINERQQIELFNRGAEKIFGYRAAEAMGQPLDILLPQAFRLIHRRHVDTFGKSPEQSRRMAERNSSVFGRRKDGHEFSAEASVAKLQTKSGMLYTVMLKDISQRQQTLEKLQASKALLAKAEKIAKLGSWEYDHETKQRSWSDELFNILGFDKTAAIPSCAAILERVHPEDLLLVKKTLRLGHNQGEAWELNYRLALPDGTVKYIESRGEPTVDPEGRVIKVLETIVDVSDRVQAQKSLQRSEKQLKLITDALPILIAYIDAQQCYRYNNRTYETWFGRPRSTLYGLPMPALVGEENYQKMQPYVEMALAGKEVSFETQPTAENGSTYWISATYIPDFDLKGEVKGFFSMVEDITERKAIEQMKTEFVSIASHEMRTPLTSIHGVLKLLCAGRLGEISNSGVKMADMALRNSDRLIHLVSDILDIERMESGRDEITKTTCDSAILIQQAIDTVSSMAAEQKIRLETDSQSIQFLGDRERLAQALTNLLSNAIKFSPENSKVAIASQVKNKSILFSVADKGRGIPTGKLEAIFERFQQVDASDSRKKGGTGLGLAICRHIIEQHGGEIWVKSTFGRGSTFYFTIPLS
ncbi:MAG: PAS domain S-box protein [Cyanobacteria bacterium J06598_4]